MLNALGEPSQVGSYANNIRFHPNGAISGFSFGNNIAHSLTQTVEGTPKLNADGTVLKDLYTYDANGNVATIVDQRSTAPDGWFNRTMAYDDLDRLASVTAPGVWTNATYLYDPVDDLRSVSVGTRGSTRAVSGLTFEHASGVRSDIRTRTGQFQLLFLKIRERLGSPTSIPLGHCSQRERRRHAQLRL